MKFDEAIKIFESFGTGYDNIFYVQLKGNLEKKMSAPAKKAGHLVEKVSKVLVTKYDKYEEQQTVKDKVANGYVLTHHLKWGEWDTDHKFVINHKGNKYLRMYYPDGEILKGKDVVNETHWFIDGVEVDKQTVKDSGYLVNSYWKDDPSDCLTVNVENIVEMVAPRV